MRMSAEKMNAVTSLLIPILSEIFIKKYRQRSDASVTMTAKI